VSLPYSLNIILKNVTAKKILYCVAKVMTPGLMINNYTSRRVGQILFQRKVVPGFYERFDLCLEWIGSGFPGFQG
jgi:hypothetical protein